MTISDRQGGILTCDYRWPEYTPDGTRVTVVCGEPLQNIGEFNEICPNWNKHTQGNDMRLEDSIQDNGTNTSPSTPPVDSITLDTILADNTTHYERTCMYCGRTWLGLHCPHDGYQNACPNCNRKPTTIDYHGCTCQGVTDLEQVTKDLNAWHTKATTKELLEARIDELENNLPHSYYMGEQVPRNYFVMGNNIDKRITELRKKLQAREDNQE